MMRRKKIAVSAVTIAVAMSAPACDWRGANSIPLPGTAGSGPDTFTIHAQLPDVVNIQPNSRVRVGDVNVGTVTKIELQDWHALLTMRLNSDVDLPANATVIVGQTSLLGSLHVELAPPKNAAPEGKLHDGSLIPLASGRTYPTTEQTLAAVALLLNNGGVGQIQDITEALSTAFAGREDDLRNLIEQLNTFAGNVNGQTRDIIAASDSLNHLVGQFADGRETVDRALKTIPDALAVLSDRRSELTAALDRFGQFSALTADTLNQTHDKLTKELSDLGPVLESLANAGPALTRSLSYFSTFPFVKEGIPKFVRGDYLNFSPVVDLTLSRIDAGFFTGTRWEGDLTELELQWGRTIGQMPSPYTAANPLIIPYQADQGR